MEDDLEELRQRLEDTEKKCHKLEGQLMESAKAGQMLVDRNADLLKEIEKLQSSLDYEREESGNGQKQHMRSFSNGMNELEHDHSDLQRRYREMTERLKETESKLVEAMHAKEQAFEDHIDAQAERDSQAREFLQREQALHERIEHLEEELAHHHMEAVNSKAQDGKRPRKQVSFGDSLEDSVMTRKSTVGGAMLAMRSRASSAAGKSDISKLEEDIATLQDELIRNSNKIATLDAEKQKLKEERDFAGQLAQQRLAAIAELTEEVHELRDLCSTGKLTRKSMVGPGGLGGLSFMSESYTSTGIVGLDDEETSFAAEFENLGGRRKTRGALMTGCESISFLMNSQAMSECGSESMGLDGDPTESTAAQDFRGSRSMARSVRGSVALDPQAERFLASVGLGEGLREGSGAEPLLPSGDSPSHGSRAPEQQDMSTSSLPVGSVRRQRSTFKPQGSILLEDLAEDAAGPEHGGRKPWVFNCYCCEVTIRCGKPSEPAAASEPPREPGRKRAALRRALTLPRRQLTFIQEPPLPDFEEWALQNDMVLGGAVEMTGTASASLPDVAAGAVSPKSSDEQPRGREATLDSAGDPHPAT